MKIIIENIEITNFKGILETLRIDFADKVTTIYGANHSGKTTTMDAMLWLFFGKNSAGESTFGIDPKDALGNIIHNLENDVKATINVDGRHIHLQRTRREIWKKSRGEDTGTYTHTTDYHIDGQKQSEKEYNEYIENYICKPTLFKALTNPTYFPTLPPADQRALLIKMVGEITNEQVAEQNAAFANVVKNLEGTTLENYRRQIAYKIKEIRSELETIPGRIAENKTPLAEIEKQQLDFERIYSAIEDTEMLISNQDAQIADNSKAADARFFAIDEMRAKVEAINTKVRQGMQEVENINREARSRHNQLVQEAADKERLVSIKLRGIEQELEEYQNTLNRNELRKVDIRKRWQEVEEMTFVYNARENCPTCGQRLPDDTIEMARVRAEKQFNDTKQTEQDALDARIKEVRDIDTRTKAEMAQAQKRKDELEKELKDAAEKHATIEAVELPELRWEGSPEAQNLREQLDAARQELQRVTEINTNATAEETRQQLMAKKKELTAKRDQLRDQMAKKAIAERHLNRIAELEKREAELNQQITELECQEDTAKEFFMEGIKMLEAKVNNLFTIVEFQMFKKLMNGGVEPTCECTMHGTPYSDLSYSEKTNAALDIINAMCLYNDIYAPIFIDNAESITQIERTTAQQIRLEVSTNEKLVVVATEF